MDTKEIQKRVNALSKAMLGKGLREPVARLEIESNLMTFEVMLRWKDVTKPDSGYSSGEYKFFKKKSPELGFDEADAFVAAMPSAEETRTKQFMGALANVIDLGKSNGIDVEFLNPLQATMKKLSENILTDQRAA